MFVTTALFIIHNNYSRKLSKFIVYLSNLFILNRANSNIGRSILIQQFSKYSFKLVLILDFDFPFMSHAVISMSDLQGRMKIKSKP